jgi:L-amino acid N-acyltransferase YncA
MPTIELAHIRERTVNGYYIDFAVFNANAANHTDTGRSRLLSELAMRARNAGLKVDAAALAYEENGEIRFYGSKNVVNWLSESGVPFWNKTLSY